MSTFESLNIKSDIIEKLKEISITTPTAVQTEIIPLVEQGKNIMFQSETGTGKTFAYLLPLVQKISQEDSNKEIKLLIASPTYELAGQIKVLVQKISDLKCALCIGGAPINRQIELLREKPQIVIGGPARLMELIHLKKLKTSGVSALVLDEADRLLAPELRDATKELMERLPQNIQIIGNSATVSLATKKILEQVRNSTDKIEFIKLPEENILRKKITHLAIFAENRDKIDTLRSFIYSVKPEKLIVFTGRTDQIQNIVSKLKYKKIDCEGLSSKTEKKFRKAYIDRFRSGKLKILITSDLTSRGLDIPGITHVIQMDLPENEDFFIHRAGRTARAGLSGINCVIGDEVEMKRYAALEKKLGITVYPKVLYKGKLCAPDEI